MCVVCDSVVRQVNETNDKKESDMTYHPGNYRKYPGKYRKILGTKRSLWEEVRVAPLASHGVARK